MARYTKKDVDGRCYIEGANGKTVFLTKELAEKALAEREGK